MSRGWLKNLKLTSNKTEQNIGKPIKKLDSMLTATLQERSEKSDHAVSDVGGYKNSG